MQISNNFNKCTCEYPMVIGCYNNDQNILKDSFDLNLNEIIKDMDLTLGNISSVYTLGKLCHKKLYVVGLGEKHELTDQELCTIFNHVSKIKEEKIIINLNTFGNVHKCAKICTYELNYGTYEFLDCKSKKEEKELIVKYYADEDISEDINNALVLSTAVNNARDLVNKPYNYLNACDLATYSEELFKQINNDKVSVEIFNKKQIEEMKMGAFLGVNKGSTDEPRLIYIKYQGLDKWENVIGLVGKGIMFDTGGYSLKSSMIHMKDDMAGAATVLAVLETLVKNNALCNVVVVIAATDNRINGEALLPDDVITASNGTTIEIVSTDAEGRLTLADAVLFAQEKGCNEIIDVATLTGACVVALGEYVTGLFSNNNKNTVKFIKCASEVNEDVWELPIPKVIEEKLRSSKVADILNSTGREMGAGASGAAAFIKYFINKDVNWIHLDIAGTAFHTSPQVNEKYGATGAMIKTIYKYIIER